MLGLCREPDTACAAFTAMSQESPSAAEEPDLDGDGLARALRQQIDAVKAQVEAHREVMQAAGLAAAPEPEPPPADASHGEAAS